MSLGRPMQHFAQMPHSAHLAHTVPVTQLILNPGLQIKQIPDPEKHIGDLHQKLAPYKPKVFAA